MNEKEAADAHKAAEALYHRILKGWNDHDGDAFSAPFAEEGLVIGFDGSENVGRAGIAEQMNKIFADHETGRYVGKIKSIKVPLPDLAVVHAVAGVLPAGSDDINPKLNAVQTMVAVRRSGEWRVELYQNTPAQFHGRPEAVDELTTELRAVLKDAG